ncbi:nucleolar protein 12-like isoform X2 [Acropora millepora]|uniref:nucleolar protein 12-like isoform X2 n=1 Tax=Acropora millepora TaxID=45264 RepID=UPI001CF11507|nr:nucleolar protein 12-like isoform X2 [Acropora millepora]
MVAKKEWKKGGFKKVLVFDENSRREYLLGFRKRKNERRKQAQQEQVEKEKAKKRELKQEKKRNLLEQMQKQRQELEAYDSDVDEDEDEDQDQQDIPSLDKTYDLPEHVVTVTTIDDIDLNTDRFPVIGPNKKKLMKRMQRLRWLKRKLTKDKDFTSNSERRKIRIKEYTKKMNDLRKIKSENMVILGSMAELRNQRIIKIDDKPSNVDGM